MRTSNGDSAMNKNGRVFISYERSDAEIAASLRLALRAEGLDIWWDEELRSGQHWAETIDDELLGARAIVVLWSEASAKSDWVMHEASIGKARGILTHARIDSVEIPAPFRSVQLSDLSNWNNRENDPEFRKLVDAIKDTDPESYRTSSKRWNRLLCATSLLVVASIAIGLFVNRSGQQPEELGLIDDGKTVWRVNVPVRLRSPGNLPLTADHGELQQVRVELEPPITSATAHAVGFWVVSDDGEFPTARFTIPGLSVKPETLDLNDSNRMMRKSDTLEMNGIAPIWLTVAPAYNERGANQPPEEPE